MDDEQSVNQLSTMPTRATAAFILSPTLTLRCMGHQRHNSTSLATNACSHVLPRHPLSNPLRPFAPARAHAARGARAALTWMSAAPGGQRGSDGEANADAEAVGGEGGAVDDEEMVDVDEDEDDEQKISPEEQRKLQGMRRRLEGLFGSENDGSAGDGLENFDGEALRQALIDRWGVQFDVQPQRRHNRVYVQIMWRYFEQQSFYMDEEEYANHCEAVAILLKRWGVVEYFLDFISTIKKRPVVGIAVNVPIPGLDGSTPFDV